MSGGSFFALLDNLMPVLKDVVLMSKTTIKNTAALGGDDLVVNAQQVSDFRASRKWDVLRTMVKWSLVNKAILIGGAVGISALGVPGLVTGLLMTGGSYLCYGGFKKLVTGNQVAEKKPFQDDAATDEDIAVTEKKRLRNAVKSDFIMSAEIVVVTLGMAARAPLLTQMGVLVATGTAFTVGVYGMVAAITAYDNKTPRFMKALSGIGTAAMLAVGGGILLNNAPGIAPAFKAAVHGLDAMPYIGGMNSAFLTVAGDAAGGLIAGAVMLAGAKMTTPAVTWTRRSVSRLFGGMQNTQDGSGKDFPVPAQEIMPPTIKKNSGAPELENKSGGVQDAWKVAAEPKESDGGNAAPKSPDILPKNQPDQIPPEP